MSSKILFRVLATPDDEISTLLLRKFVYFCLTLFALYNVFKISLLGNVNSDHTDTLMLWYGFKAHGWAFIKTWLYTQDNWLLSLFPFHAVLFSLFPFTPRLILLAGLSVFLLNVLLCSLIAYTLRVKNSIWLVAIFILCSSDFFYFNSNPLDPICHNMTHFFGLLSLLFAILWVRSRDKLALAMIGLSMIIAGLSDPWFMPTYALPLLLTALKQKQTPLLKTVIASIIIILTRFFGLFSFLHGMSYKWVKWSQFLDNLDKLEQTGLTLNFFPTHAHWSAVTSLIIILLLSGLIFLKLSKQNESSQLFFLTLIFSLSIMSLSFLFYANASLYYLFNLPILIILGIVVGVELCWEIFSSGTKTILTLLGILYVVSGLSSTIPLWKNSPNLEPDKWEPLTKLLATQGWTYGYADYGVASDITGFSHDTIRVRPIGFLPQNGYMYQDKRKQTSPFWYQSSDIPNHQKSFFVYWTPAPGRNDRSVYQNGLIKQFGPPSIFQTYGEGFIMVWDHPLKIQSKEDIISWENKVTALFSLMLI